MIDKQSFDPVINKGGTTVLRPFWMKNLFVFDEQECLMVKYIRECVMLVTTRL